MKKIFNLTINEIIKESSKIPFLILCGFLILFSVLTPIVYKNTYRFSRYEHTLNGGNWNLGYLTLIKNPGFFEQNITEEQKQTDEYKRFMEVKQEIKNVANQYKNLVVISSSYRNEFYRELIEKTITHYIYSLYLENPLYKNNRMIYEYYNMYLDKGCLEKDDAYFQERKEELNREIQYLNDVVVNNDYNKYFDYMVYKTKKDIEKANNNTELTTNEISSVMDMSDMREANVYMLEIYEELAKKDIKGYESEYIINYLFDIKKYSAYALSPISNNGYSSKYKNLEEYHKVVKQSQKRFLQESDKLKYAVLNDIDYQKSGIREAVENILSNIKYVSIFVLLISCGMVTREFDKGSIRLLITKPTKRWKVMLSKILTIIFYSFVFTFIYVGLAFLTSIIIYGAKDLAIPMIEYGSEVYTTNYLIYILKYTLLNVPSLIFLGTLSLCLSVLFRNTVFPMLSSIALLFLSVIFIGLMDFIYIPFAKILFLPHLNLYNLMTFPFIEELEFVSKASLSLSGSIINLLVHSIIFSFITILVFNKKDIEN